jgi:uncharacterized protein (DUF2062 family)
MARRYFKDLTARFQPAIDRFTGQPWVRRHAPALGDPDLWHLNRRSTARAVAIGLGCGLVPGPLQAISAAAVCLVWRANLPLAIVTTFYTNPFTIVPLYVVAYELGTLVVPGATGAGQAAPPAFTFSVAGLREMVHWAVSLGPTLGVGLMLLGVTLATLGFVAVHVGWRIHVVRAWRRRAATRA